MKIIAVRHGETDHNVKRLVSGWVEARLTETGKAEAAEVVEFEFENGGEG